MNEQMTTERNIPTAPLHAVPLGQSRYYSIAMPMLEKGFTVWPVKPEPEKTGEFGWNTQAYYADEITHRCLAKKFPNHNAAVVSKRGVANLMFLDIDSPGVLERIEVETPEDIRDYVLRVQSARLRTVQTAPLFSANRAQRDEVEDGKQCARYIQVGSG